MVGMLSVLTNGFSRPSFSLNRLHAQVLEKPACQFDPWLANENLHFRRILTILQTEEYT